MKKLFFTLSILSMLFTSCHNQDWEFDDFDYTTVYFAYQSPVRTIVMGEDIFDTSLDNEKKCKIMATTGGAYTNKHNIIINCSVDNSLCDNLVFKSTMKDVVAMPTSYYTLSSNQIKIPKGSIIGGVEVQLTDAYFADPMALSTNYVIPIVMTEVQNADSILRGKPSVDNPNRCIAGDWSIVPKDYTLYAIKYINAWHANYLRRGVDVVTGNNGNASLNKTIVRRQAFVEKDEVCGMTTQSLKTAIFPVKVNGTSCELLLTFDSNNNCVVTSEDGKATGSGKFVEKGEKQSWGNKDRNAIYLDYQIKLDDVTYTTKDTLVVRDRGISLETFDVISK